MTNETNKTDYNKVKPNPKAADKGGDAVEQAVNAERRKLQPIAAGEKAKKKGLAERFVAGLVGPHGLRAIGSSVNHNIIIPTVKKLMYDTFVAAASQAIFKDDRGVTTRNDAWNQPAARRGTNYNAPYRGNRRSRTTATSNGPVRDNYAPVEVQQGIPEYVIPDRNAAVQVMNAMQEELNSFNQVTLAAYLQLLGRETNYNDYALGWFDLTDAYITPTRGGHMIVLPQLEQLN